MSLLNTLTSTTTKSKKRIGRGYGSGKGGHTSTRGTKGARSRVGNKLREWFEGGQLPVIKRLPMMRGKGRLEVLHPTAEITLTDLDRMKATTISLDTLKLEKIIDPRYTKAKVIANGQINRAVTIEGLRVSQAAAKAIEKAGGAVAN
jgi:large subunit ribosomal protein L15